MGRSSIGVRSSIGGHMSSGREATPRPFRTARTLVDPPCDGAFNEDVSAWPVHERWAAKRARTAEADGPSKGDFSAILSVRKCIQI